MAAVLQDREQQIQSLQSEVQNRKGDITGGSEAKVCRRGLIGSAAQVLFITCHHVSSAALQAELRAAEQQLKDRQQQQDQLEETLDLVRKELNKTEQARKDASIKVTTSRMHHKQATVRALKPGPGPVPVS